MLFDDTDFGAGALFGVQRLHALQIRQEVQGTICPISNDPFYLVTYYIKWVTTSWTEGIVLE